MKKNLKLILSLFLIIVLFSCPLLALEQSTSGVNLTDNQKKILKDFGLHDDQIKNITMEEIRDLLANGKPANIPTSLRGEVTKNLNEEMSYIKEMHDKLIEKGLSCQNIDALHKMGYTHEEMLEMNKDKLKEILSKTQVPFGSSTFSSETGILSVGTCPICYSHPAPSSLDYLSSVLYFGGYNEYFVPAAYTAYINLYYVNYCLNAVQEMFDLPYNYSSTEAGQNLRFSYYLFGEWGECFDYWGLHEGVDLQCKTDETREVKAIAPGQIVYINRSSKYLNVYDPGLGVTYNYQHLSNIPYDLSVGDEIETYDPIGTQNSSDKHIHVQVCNHTECTNVHTGYDHDYNLECIIPYFYMIWYL